MVHKMKSTKNNRKSDGKFRKKTIKHNPQEESSRAVFEDPKAKEEE
ncbi:hypothetical protein KQI86_14620 [Clostridium sp. MSJ-11]|uniref:Uncharacterized protein n=1 Tax=Clostridium mobile TaxID=2841512 RepID=A0ABS6EK09_9CLOT|nr:CPC_1213 family protein [Clostridium mobile]MBU5485552.1 hypothetical protein [Clostridium mobile]